MIYALLKSCLMGADVTGEAEEQGYMELFG